MANSSVSHAGMKLNKDKTRAQKTLGWIVGSSAEQAQGPELRSPALTKRGPRLCAALIPALWREEDPACSLAS